MSASVDRHVPLPWLSPRMRGPRRMCTVPSYAPSLPSDWCWSDISPHWPMPLFCATMPVMTGGTQAMGITTQLAQFTADIRLDRLPPDVVRRSRFLVLDLVGNIVRARHDAESTPSFVAAARAMGMAAGNSGVFGDAARYTPVGAAFLNGALAHSLDID